MTLLEAVNLCLRSTGEAGVAAINSAHPKIATILAEIDAASRRVQKRGWWFNTADNVTLAVQTSGPKIGKIDTTPYDLVVPTYRSQDYYPLGGVLVDRATGLAVGTAVQARTRTVYATDATVWLTLPDVFTDYVANVAALSYASNYDADPLQLKKLQYQVTSAYSMLTQDHARYSRVNLFASGSTGAALNSAWGHRYGRYN